jgi:hypothetical protein
MIDEEIVIMSERDDSEYDRQDWELELIEVVRAIDRGSKRYEPLPTKSDIDEWDIMRRFCDNVEDDRLSKHLLDTIRGRGAFRRFKDELDRNGMLDRWFDFKYEALRGQAVAWCIENDIPFTQPAKAKT